MDSILLVKDGAVVRVHLCRRVSSALDYLDTAMNTHTHDTPMLLSIATHATAP